ncbi:hypothetical protein EVAR_2521_1 [Eumeta japonica]|uniref:Mariner Mos1 transposase n=1 Tax=Eumeta variegata TaxID=151549 RepID=A0A4C1SNM3_EUMVA|nr:hypothetical protein EVAR_2521_1 [Eumeta japonica]
MSTVRLMIKTDKGVTYQQIRTSSGIGMSQVHKILHEHLALRELCTGNLIIRRSKTPCLNWCCEIMQRFSGGELNAMYAIVTGHDCWIYCYDPETKRQPAQRVFPFEELSTELNEIEASKMRLWLLSSE